MQEQLPHPRASYSDFLFIYLLNAELYFNHVELALKDKIPIPRWKKGANHPSRIIFLGKALDI